ncbi:GyrI-like domain-containing protein [Paenibacillus thermotolerans]|uniref:GyrI-like domain-containing protein n=1 Tax=Paenibacillus thermotolerans TaxID=3027807 RepID=UPI0023687BC6|nr:MULTISPECIES: GyrI-like domain-containing protein [unclassified Paenibacillus]
MNIHIGSLDRLRLVGITADVSNENYLGTAVSKLIKDFMKRLEEIPSRKNDNVYILSLFSDDYMPGKAFTLFACVETDLDDLPEGMSVRTIPAHQYAVTAHTGSARTIGTSIDQLLKQWLPKSDYVEASPFYIQRYDIGFKESDDLLAEIEIWCPVKMRMEKQGAVPYAVPSLNFDGGLVDILWDYHEGAVEWFAKHFNWKSRETYYSHTEKMTQHAFGVWLNSFLPENKPNYFMADRGIEPNIRWCWNTKDLVGTHMYFKENNIRVSEIYDGPGDRQYFDVWSTYEGTRLTVCGWPELEQDYGARLCPGWIRIGVKDIRSAVDWYQRYVGMSLLEEHFDKGCALMGLGVEHHPGNSLWWLETLPSDAYTGQINGPARPCCVLHDSLAFQNYHTFLQESGVSVSGIFGNVGGFARFHFFDPDGNRFNIQKY